MEAVEAVEVEEEEDVSCEDIFETELPESNGYCSNYYCIQVVVAEEDVHHLPRLQLFVSFYKRHPKFFSILGGGGGGGGCGGGGGGCEFNSF